MQELKIEYLNVTELTPYAKNTRKHKDFDVDNIVRSIGKYGFNDPIGIWGENNVIVEGHGRLLAAKKLKIKTVPVVRLDHMTDDQRREYAIAHNATAELSEWDFDILPEELADLDLSDFDFDFGIDDEEEETEIVEDEAPEVEEKIAPVTKRGDIWQLGRHRLMCGDSTSAEDFASLMGEDRADMVFTDPPYNVAIGSKNAFLNSVQPSGRCTEDIANDKGMTDEEIGETLWKPAFENMRAFSKDCCNIYVTMPQGGTHMMMMMMMMMAGWQVKHELMWAKNAPTFSMGRLDYDYQHEPIVYGWNKTHIFYGKGEQNKSIWHYDKPKKCDLHPTMKPVALVVNALLNSSEKENIVLDGFGGSGTTLIACEETQRCARLIELDPKYCDVIVKRWENLTGERAVLLNG